MPSKTLIAIFVLAVALSGCSAANPAAVLPWSHHETGYEIYSPAISPDNSRVVFTHRRHIPDGHEAELFSREELADFHVRIKDSPRYADPEIAVMDIGGKTGTFLDYGWNPVFSRNGQKVLYARQTNPASGLRTVAASFSGNSIHEYDLRANRTVCIAEPLNNTEYFSIPRYDDKGVPVFFISGPANGAWGGEIGVATVEGEARKLKILYAPTKEYGLYHLVKNFQVQDGTCLVLRRRPLGPGLYLADSYTHDLVDAQRKTVVYTWGAYPVWDVLANYRLCPSGPEIYHNGWLPLPPPGHEVPRSGRPAEKPEQPEAAAFTSVSSPDCSAAAFINKDRTQVSILLAGGKNTRTWTAPSGSLQSVTWSPDGTRIALVITHEEGYLGKFLFDELVILRVTDLPTRE